MSIDKGVRAPPFNSIKTSLYSELNRTLPKDIIILINSPKISPSYTTSEEEDFVIYIDIGMLYYNPLIRLKFRASLFHCCSQ